jgi:uncharacterized FAD-dependent dehydrogenase
MTRYCTHQNQERLRLYNSRDPITYEHVQIKLYPCGEAGYAGGIISAAIDGKMRL